MRIALMAAGLAAVLCGCQRKEKEQAATVGKGTPIPAALAGGTSGLHFEGPYVHENLAVYVVTGPKSDDRNYVTLDEGLANGTVAIREVGAAQGQDQSTVNTLEVENKSDQWLFLQAGDVVKGGKQDRTIGISVAIAPHTAPQPIQSFCVEHGRWTPQRGSGLTIETANSFDGNTGIVNGNEFKIELQNGKSQGKVWEEVAKQAARAGQVLKAAEASPAAANAPAVLAARPQTAGALQPSQAPSAPPDANPSPVVAQVAAPNASPAQQPAPAAGQVLGAAPPAQVAVQLNASAGSHEGFVGYGESIYFSDTGTYNAILENDKVLTDRDAYVSAILPRLREGDDRVGVIVAINGEVTAAEVYGSPALFRKLSKKLLESHALEALLSRDPAKKAPAPSPEAVLAFLREPGKAQAKDEQLEMSMHRRTLNTEKAVRFEYRSGSDSAPPVGWSQYGH